MLIKVRTYRPIRRFILIQFTFPVLSVSLFIVILFATAIWLNKTCKMDLSIENTSTFSHVYSFKEVQRINDAKMCFWPKIDNYDDVMLLSDVLAPEIKPKPGKSIFFHETSCTENSKVHLNARQACAIESAAKWNANRDIFVTFTANVGISTKSNSPIITALLTYPNVYMCNMNLSTYTEATPMHSLFSNGQLFLSKYLNSHTSDFLRYTSMLKFGGIYLDLDVVVLQSLETLPHNFVGAESARFVGVGAMGFQNDGIGHEIANLCVDEFAKSFSGESWGNNGPGVLTRVLKNICNTEHIIEMHPEKCWDFEVFPRNAFYAVNSKSWQMFFDPNATETVLQMINSSVIVHVWNKHSATKIIHKSSKPTAYEVIASKNCPKVYQASGGEF